MIFRTNEHLSHIVNKGIIICKLKGYDEAKHMMLNAGLSDDVIDRVLNQSPNVRTSDWR